MFPSLGASGKLDIFLQDLFWCTRFLIFYYLHNREIDAVMRIIWFYWIHIKICGESVPLRPDRTEIIYKSPEGLTKSVRSSGLFFLPPESVFKRVTQNNDTARKGSELMIRPILRDCAKYARGPPKWIRTDSLWGSKTEKVNQIWFTPKSCPNAPRVGLIAHIGHGRKGSHKTKIWRVCGAVGRREPYNLTLESKTYYTQNYDTMR